MSARIVGSFVVPVLGLVFGLVLGASFQGCLCVPLGSEPQAPVRFEITDAPIPEMIGGTVLLVDEADEGYVEVRWGEGADAKLVRYDRLGE